MYSNNQQTSIQTEHHESLLNQSELMNQFHTSSSVSLNNQSSGLSESSSHSHGQNSNALRAFSSSMKRKNTIHSKAVGDNNTNNNNNAVGQVIPSSSIVPTLTNVDEIFHLLSQKIAKYCQILADLTNCEVFYKVSICIND